MSSVASAASLIPRRKPDLDLPGELVDQYAKIPVPRLEAKHPVCARLAENWQFFQDCYEGGEIYRRGKHLQKFPRENEEDFAAREERAYYSNYTAAVLEIPLGHLFKQEIVRTLSRENGKEGEQEPLAEGYNAFLKNVDGKGTNMDAFARQAMLAAMTIGWCPVFLDVPRFQGRVRSLADQKAQGVAPYIHIVSPLNVLNWSSAGEFVTPNGGGQDNVYAMARRHGFTGNLGPLHGKGTFGSYYGDTDPTDNENPFGLSPSPAFFKPEWIRYQETAEADPSEMFPSANEQRWHYKTLAREFWFCHDSDGHLIDGGKSLLGDEVPMAVFYARQSLVYPLVGPSTIADIAFMAKAIYNIDSWIDKILHDVTFPMLRQPVSMSSDEDGQMIDTTTIWEYPEGARHPPDYISPSSEPVEVLMRRREGLAREIYRLAKLSSVISTEKRVAESGLKSAFDFEETNQHIADLAAFSEAAEQEISRMWMKVTADDDDPWLLTTRYPRKFDIFSLMDEVTQSLVLNQLHMPDEWWRLIKRSIGQKTLQRTNAETEEIQEALRAIMEQPDGIMEEPILTERQTQDIIDKGVHPLPKGPAAR